MAGASPEHNRIVFNLTLLLGLKFQGGGCEVWPSDQRMYVEANTLFTYPDLSIVCGEPVFYKDDKMSLTNPAVIIEVLSPSTRDYDRGNKFELYKGLASLREYILVDSRTVSVEQYTRDQRGAWAERKYEKPGDVIVVGVGGADSVGRAELLVEAVYENVRFRG
jgi:Uma2 family endonuclease